jgi:hypothetical protein
MTMASQEFVIEFVEKKKKGKGQTTLAYPY